MIPRDHILANVNEAYNALYVEGDFVGPTLYYGLGAGRKATGSAVVSDIMNIARQIRLGVKSFIPSLAHVNPPSVRTIIQPMTELTTAYYFRFSAVDQPGVLSKIAGILGEHNISILSVIQKGRDVKGSVPVVMLTHEARERDTQKAIALIDKLDVVTHKTMVLRVEKSSPHGEER
jgi:homoserine dehydrogenase